MRNTYALRLTGRPGRVKHVGQVAAFDHRQGRGCWRTGFDIGDGQQFTTTGHARRQRIDLRRQHMPKLRVLGHVAQTLLRERRVERNVGRTTFHHAQYRNQHVLAARHGNANQLAPADAAH